MTYGFSTFLGTPDGNGCHEGGRLRTSLYHPLAAVAARTSYLTRTYPLALPAPAYSPMESLILGTTRQHNAKTEVYRKSLSRNRTSKLNTCTTPVSVQDKVAINGKDREHGKTRSYTLLLCSRSHAAKLPAYALPDSIEWRIWCSIRPRATRLRTNRKTADSRYRSRASPGDLPFRGTPPLRQPPMSPQSIVYRRPARMWHLAKNPAHGLSAL